MVSGDAQRKELMELVPDILSQLGPDNIASLRRMAESYQKKGGMSSSLNWELEFLKSLRDFDTVHA